MTQRERVLAYLTKWGNDTDSNMSVALSIPAPTIRRTIQELIAEGHVINYMGKDGYVLHNNKEGSR